MDSKIDKTFTSEPWRILLIDDDEDDYLLTRSLLEDIRNGQFKLDWVDHFDVGLEACIESSYDAYLIDYQLGERDGLELVRAAIAHNCRKPIILLTGQGNYQVDVEAMRIGVTDYLVKGEVNSQLLERSLRYAIENKQAEEALRKAHDEMEQRVQDRTRELQSANSKLRAEILERQRIESELRKSEQRFRTLAETTSSAIFILEGSKIRYANPAAKTITGYDPGELLDQDFWIIAHPTYQDVLKRSNLASSWNLPQNPREPVQIPIRYEIKVRTRSGEVRWVDVTIGEMSHEGKPARILTAFDITERDLAEQALQKAKNELESRVAERTAELAARTEELRLANIHLDNERARLKAIIENAPEGIVVVDEQAKILLSNPAANRLYARPIPYNQDFEELSSLQLCYPDGLPYDPRDLPLTRSALDAEVHTDVEMLVTWPDSQRRTLLVNTAPILVDSGKVTGAVGILQDITQRKQADNQSRIASAQIEVQRRLIQQREMERLNIAQDLHDGPLQELIGLLFKLQETIQLAAADPQATAALNNEALLASLKTVKASLDAQIRELRTFCSELRPPALAPFGLEKAILSHARSFQQKHPALQLHLDLIRDGKLLDEQMRMALFRIYQELLNNVVRHSNADQATVRLALEDERVLFEVQDNGIGFEVPGLWVEMARQGHLGLVGVQERAEAVGGLIKIKSARGEGTTVRVVVPFNPPD